MRQDKSSTVKNSSASTSHANGKPPIVIHRKRIYKLRGISYMGLSLTYIALLLTTAVVGLALLAYCSTKGNIIALILVALVLVILLFSIFHIGIRYGEYGLEIILAKALQAKYIKNDFPSIEKHLLQQATLFPQQTLTELSTNEADANTANPSPQNTDSI